ncbi:hypothetical protein BDR26DRAFT_850934 [Obelidium mucronatum]|nr:hypothetical protein BDR26DRAFT_850934 [Obelidium mucronatum]
MADLRPMIPHGVSHSRQRQNDSRTQLPFTIALAEKPTAVSTPLALQLTRPPSSSSSDSLASNLSLQSEFPNVKPQPRIEVQSATVPTNQQLPIAPRNFRVLPYPHLEIKPDSTVPIARNPLTGTILTRPLPCTACRNSRKKCSLQRPRCSRCDHKKIPCEYTGAKRHQKALQQQTQMAQQVQQNLHEKMRNARDSNRISVKNLLNPEIEANLHPQTTCTGLNEPISITPQDSPASIACTNSITRLKEFRDHQRPIYTPHSHETLYSHYHSSYLSGNSPSPHFPVYGSHSFPPFYNHGHFAETRLYPSYHPSYMHQTQVHQCLPTQSRLPDEQERYQTSGSRPFS